MSLSLEEAVEKNLDKMRGELADVLIYVILFANENGVDILNAIEIKINQVKYPAEKFYGINKEQVPGTHTIPVAIDLELTRLCSVRCFKLCLCLARLFLFTF